jgi:hypothetical protein
MASYLILLFIIFGVIHLFGYFETERYPRYTTVRRHHRRGTYNGVRQHQRRISDGVRFKWIPYNEMILITLYKKIFGESHKND